MRKCKSGGVLNGTESGDLLGKDVGVCSLQSPQHSPSTCRVMGDDAIMSAGGWRLLIVLARRGMSIHYSRTIET